MGPECVSALGLDLVVWKCSLVVWKWSEPYMCLEPRRSRIWNPLFFFHTPLKGTFTNLW